MKHNKAQRHQQYTARKTTKRAATKSAKSASLNRAKYAPRSKRTRGVTASASMRPGLLASLLGIGR